MLAVISSLYSLWVVLVHSVYQVPVQKKRLVYKNISQRCDPRADCHPKWAGNFPAEVRTSTKRGRDPIRKGQEKEYFQSAFSHCTGHGGWRKRRKTHAIRTGKCDRWCLAMAPRRMWRNKRKTWGKKFFFSGNFSKFQKKLKALFIHHKRRTGSIINY